MHAIIVLGAVLFGVLVLFAALCILLLMATARITARISDADDPEGSIQ
jgi:hypothetical protein